jgi:hypothetical protein
MSKTFYKKSTKKANTDFPRFSVFFITTSRSWVFLGERRGEAENTKRLYNLFVPCGFWGLWPAPGCGRAPRAVFGPSGGRRAAIRNLGPLSDYG